MELELEGGTKVFGENPPSFHFVHHKYHTTWPGIEPGLARRKTSEIIQKRFYEKDDDVYPH
jgi:hypothetical protein